MKNNHRALLLLVFTSILLRPHSALFACGVVCAPLPKKTTVDHLLESEKIVLAREDADRPFHYKSEEVLLGSRVVEPIDLFLDSTTRRRLHNHPAEAVLLGKRSEDGWFRIAYIDADYRSVLQEVLTQLPAWRGKHVLNEERSLFFVDLLGHSNRQIHELAYIEVGRAPYRSIRKLGNVVSREDIYRELSNYRYVDWHPLYLLALGASGTEEGCDYISGRLENSQKYSMTTNLSAIATAYVECFEKDAISSLESLYFHQETRTTKEVEAVQAGLSEHGKGGHRYLRDAIVDSYEILLETHPQTAQLVARDLFEWNRTELVDELREILEAQFASNPLGGYHIRMYLKRNQTGNSGR